MADERRFHLGGRDPVPGHVHHIVDAAQHPDRAVGIEPGAVAGEVEALIGELGPVGVPVPLRVTPDAAQHRRPRLIQHQVAGDVLGAVGVRLQQVAVVVDDLGRDPRQRCHRRAGFGRSDSRQWRDHRRTRLGLPPGVDDREVARAEDVVVPAPCLGVDRFADRTEQPQAGQVVGVGDLAAQLHERPDQGRSGVIDCDTVFFDDLEMPVLVGRIRCALVEDFGDAVGQWAVHAVGVPGDPADVGGAPEHVALGLDVENRMHRVGTLGEIAAAGVHDALGLARGARGVEQEQRVFGVERLRGVFCGRGIDGVVPPHIAALIPGHVNSRAPHHQHVLDGAIRAPTASSAASLSGAGLPRRNCPSAVITSLAWASAIRARSAVAVKPANTTLCIRPSRAQASIAITASGINGM